MQPLAVYTDQTLEEFLFRVLRAYPSVEEAIKEIAKSGSPEHTAFHRLSVAEHWAGMQVQQRGSTFYLTRLSNIRNTAQYEQYTYTLWSKDKTAELDTNPAIAYRLFCDTWYEWKPVPLSN